MDTTFNSISPIKALVLHTSLLITIYFPKPCTTLQYFFLHSSFPFDSINLVLVSLLVDIIGIILG